MRRIVFVLLAMLMLGILFSGTTAIAAEKKPFLYQEPDGDPWGGTLDEALAFSGYTENEQALLKQAVQNSPPTRLWLADGTKLKFMVYGGKKPGSKKGVKKDVIIDTKHSKQKKYQNAGGLNADGWKVFLVESEDETNIVYRVVVLARIDDCVNYSGPEYGTWTKEKTQVTKRPVVPPVVMEKKSEPPPPVPEVKKDGGPPEFPPVPQSEGTKKARYQFDAMMGGEIYKTSHHDQDAEGWDGWWKARGRLFWLDNLGKNKKTSLGLGIFGAGGLGAGNDGDYKYRWNQNVLGATGKILGPHYDFDLDPGFGKLKNYGHMDLNAGKDYYESKQVDDIFLLSMHLNAYPRRDAGEVWFPKLELGFEGRFILNSKHDHNWNGEALSPNPTDNRAISLTSTIWFYDFKPNDHTRITPGLNLGIGREYGIRKNYFQLGPAVVFASYGQDIAQINFLNYKEQLNGEGDQWHPIGGWISIDGMWKAYKASKIHKTTDEELRKRRTAIH